MSRLGSPEPATVLPPGLVDQPPVLPRFFAPDLNAHSAELKLPRHESHHLQRVLRLRVGDQVAVFDGRGTAFRARVTSIARDGATVALLERLAEPPVPVSLTVVQGVLKGSAMDEVVRDCTMIGASSIQPVIAERTTIKASTLDTAADRWRRVALASAKQCGRARLPEIRPPLRFTEWLARDRDHPAFILLEPAVSVPHAATVRELALQPPPHAAALVVGPEGGWTTTERELALSAGCVPLSLGHLTLRAESVPLVASSALLAIWSV